MCLAASHQTALSQGFALLRDDTGKRCGVDGAAVFFEKIGRRGQVTAGTVFSSGSGKDFSNGEFLCKIHKDFFTAGSHCRMGYFPVVSKL